MELAEYGTLKQLINRFKNNDRVFSDTEASKVIKSILLAVNYIHDSNIIHRDLKPGYLLICLNITIFN